MSAAHLRAAGGTVRCGRCGAAFDALLTLSDSLLPPAPPIAPAVTGVATGVGAYHFSADDLERVFVDAREWHRQFGGTEPIPEPDAVAEVTGRYRLLEKRPDAEDVTIEGRTLRIEIGSDSSVFEPPAWAAGYDENDIESTRPLPVLRHVPEAALFDDEGSGRSDPASSSVETGSAELDAVLPTVAEAGPAANQPRVDDLPAAVDLTELLVPFEAAESSPSANDAYVDTVTSTLLEASPPPIEMEIAPVERDIERIFDAGADGVEIDVNLGPSFRAEALVDVDLEPTGIERALDVEFDSGAAEQARVDVEFPNGTQAEPAVAPAGPRVEVTEPEVPGAAATSVAAAEATPAAPIAAAATAVREIAIEPQRDADVGSLPLGAQRWRTARQYRDELPDELEDTTPAADRGRWMWAAASLVLALVLAAQVIHQRRDEFARDPRFGAALHTVYERVGLPLAPGWDPTQFELQQLGNPSEAATGTLRLRATITNRAAFAQPAPMLRIALEDRYGNPVAVRDFSASDYLEPAPAAAPMMPPGNKIDVDLTLVDPGGDAVGYQLRTCVVDAPGRLRCN